MLFQHFQRALYLLYVATAVAASSMGGYTTYGLYFSDQEFLTSYTDFVQIPRK